jgi:hypothetical protein
VDHLGLFVFWVWACPSPKVFCHLYKEARHLGFREFSCLVKIYHVLHRVSSSGENALPCYQIEIVARVLVFIKNYQAQV